MKMRYLVLAVVLALCVACQSPVYESYTDTVEDMAGIACPALIMSGEKDLIRAEHTRLIGENIPSGRVKILPGEDHGSYICNSPKLAPLMLEFFNEIGY